MKQWKLFQSKPHCFQWVYMSNFDQSKDLDMNPIRAAPRWFYSSLILLIYYSWKIWHIRSGFHQFLCDTATWRPSSTRLRLFCDALNTHWRAVVHTPAGRWGSWMMFVKLQERSAQQVWFANHLCASLWSRIPPNANHINLTGKHTPKPPAGLTTNTRIATKTVLEIYLCSCNHMVFNLRTENAYKIVLKLKFVLQFLPWCFPSFNILKKLRIVKEQMLLWIIWFVNIH